jgi:poly-gamma-glutamate synthesis protein (capsule biosynthesis protein)|tara:strand:- start:41 stop:1582 length:1542 start_codon:yes stop_codon:yes gene_type:complete
MKIFNEFEPTFSILFLGDIMSHNGIPDDFLKYIKKELRSVDFCVGNLETIFGGKPYSGNIPFSAPDSLASTLKDFGINCLVTANNHSADRSSQGIDRTIDVLDRLEIKHTGTFKSEEEVSPLILKKNNVRVAILNYTWGIELPYIPKPQVVNLIGDKSDITGKDIHPKNINYQSIKQDIVNAKNISDKVVVFFHWGDQYTFEANENQISLSNFCFDTGASIVIGAHPHVIQMSYWDQKNDTYVAYSLGNFISNQSKENTDEGLIVKLDIGKNRIEGVKENKITTKQYVINKAPYEKFIDEFYQAIKDTHNITNVGRIKVFIPKSSNYKPGKLITSGVQGDEPAGPKALLNWVKANKVPSNVYFIPILSPESYLNKTHFNNSGRNVNLEIPHNSSREISNLIQSDGFLKIMSKGGYLSCQEDPKRDVAYLLVWKNNKVLASRFLKILGDNFKLREDSDEGIRTKDMIEDNTTLGAYCAELGAPFSITIETPVKNTDLGKRIDTQVKMIDKFINL